MKLFALKCPNCGAKLEMKDDDLVSCPYCDHQFLIDREKKTTQSKKTAYEKIDNNKETSMERSSPLVFISIF